MGDLENIVLSDTDRYKRTNIKWPQLYGIPRIDRFIGKKKSKDFHRVLGSYHLMGIELLFWMMKMFWR